jgi:hypothetical protein
MLSWRFAAAQKIFLRPLTLQPVLCNAGATFFEYLSVGAVLLQTASTAIRIKVYFGNML